MTDIIQLLPDNLANQIAAGEVIQRPASAVKELMENAIDAGATEVKVFINDSGKSLVQVIDNGKGMSGTDARMCFERHATSKIRDIDDLFHIRTMGFRGEALASIAAVAQVELKTRKEQEDVGTRIEIENSIVKKQEVVATPVGTNLCMKNLFFNVPARRNFLKSNAAEMRHIVDEFIRVAMSFPEIFFSLFSNGQEVFHLEKGTLKQRILQIFGSHYNSKLVTVQENTDYLNIHGFVGKPETSKKTRGDQYFFVNNRFIRSPYLNHAVVTAYHEMISPDSFPLYVIFIDLDPIQVDVNVHPTKQEIKFEDEKIIYAFVHAAVKHALAQFSVTPTLEFDLDPSIQQLDAVTKPLTEDKRASLTSSSLYQSFTQKHQAHFIDTGAKSDLRNWKDFNQHISSEESSSSKIPNNNVFSETTHTDSIPQDKLALPSEADLSFIHLLNCYIVAPTNKGFILIHQQAAHERILYEKFANASNGKPVATQRSLFPITLQLSPQDGVLLNELINDLNELGYLIEPFGKDSFVIQGTPADVEHGNEKPVIEKLLEQYKHFISEVKFSRREKLIRLLASQHSIKPGVPLSEREMRALVTDLFNCMQPNMTAAGQPTYIDFKREYLEQLFRRM